jgi:iron complex outermembrane recepter protein
LSATPLKLLSTLLRVIVSQNWVRRMLKGQFALLVIGIGWLGLAEPVRAESVTPPPEPTATIPAQPIDLSQLPRPATTMQEWQAQLDAATVPVTGVQVKPTGSELEIILETAAGKRLTIDASKFRAEGNTLIAEIANASLALPSGQAFSAENPTADIAAIQVSQAGPGLIRVSVVGKAGLPKTSVTLKSAGLAYALNPAKGNEDEEVVVTGANPRNYQVPNATAATRIEAPLRDIPRSIQVIPRSVLEDQKVTRLDDALRNVSGVSRDASFGGTADGFLSRGFSATIFRNGFPDVPGTSTFSSLRSTANLERIESLKGPASILYGSLSPGGVVNLATKQPLGKPLYALGFSAGSFRFFEPTVDFTGPLTRDGQLKYRLNVSYQNSSGFRDFTSTEQVFVAPVIAWQVNDRTNLTFELEYLRDRRPFDTGLVAFGRGVADLPIERRLGDPSDVRRIEDLSLSYNFNYKINTNWTLRNSFRALFNDNFTRRFESDFGGVDETTGILERQFRIVEADRQSYLLRTEATGKFQTGPFGHQILMGFDLARVTSLQTGFRDRNTPPIDIFNPVYTGLLPTPPLSFQFNERTSSAGVYVQDLITLTRQLKVLAGGRLDFVDQRSRDFVGETESQQRQIAFSPTVGLVYQPNTWVSLYGSYSRSFEPNSALRADGTFLQPERGTQWEVGSKFNFLNQRLSSNIAFYYLTRSNVGTVDPNNPDFSIPIGEQRSRGFEFDIAGEILPGWRVIGQYTYTDAVITDGDEFTPTGNRFPNIPRHSASLWSTYEIQSSRLKGLGFGLGVFFVDRRAGDTENSFTLPGYVRLDAALYYRYRNVRTAINFRNLSNTRYFESSIVRSGIAPGAPFSVVGSVSVEF